MYSVYAKPQRVSINYLGLNKPFECGYWNEFDKIVSYLRKDGLMRTVDEM